MTDSPAGASELARFASEISFDLDPFQRDACAALEDGHSVLVCAPTGAGKTIVGEFAVHMALASGGKCFYTTPIKALSNQKFADLTARYGRDSVGLLTGDQSINPDAPVVVMTTEVLRNMLYASSDALRGLSYVVMDEVHYLADRFRGAVWEEVILHLPPDVRLVSLSATVSNAEEFGAWMETVRGDTAVVVDETRPVPLWQHVMVGRRMFDLFDTKSSDQKVLVDEDLVRFIRQRETADRMQGYGGPRGRGGRSGFRPLPRPEVLARLDEEGLLPAITFIFSRAGCDGALAQCLRSRLDLSRPGDSEQIDAIIDKHTGDLPKGDLEVLGYWEWREALHRGLAAHHAGMLPAFRHTVEDLFVRGLVRAVFATETLALGINMPARTVVLERLVKFNGESHAELTPGEYTQLTGRAGRRGIDVEGHAVVLWQPEVDTSAVAGLASTRTYPLRSSFRPGYNMSINLIDRMGAQEARALLERSFAQFQADRSVVGLVRGIERNQGAMRKLESQLGGVESGFMEYMSLRERIKQREREIQQKGRADRRGAAVKALIELRRGDVVAIPSGRRAGLAVILEPDQTPGDPRPLVLTEDHWAGRVSAADFPVPAEALGHMRLPRRVDHRTARIRRDLASALRGTGISAPGRRRRNDHTRAGEDRELATLRRSLRAHPAHNRPDREQLSRTGERYARLARETETMRQKVAATTNSLARTFDRIVGLLEERGFVERGEVTADGRRLARIYAESDLVVAEALRQGLWRGLGPAELAAVVSTLVYESRQEGGFLTASGPTEPIRRAVGATIEVWSQLRADESRHKLPPTREPDLGFVTGVYKWARGDALAEALLASGDQGTPLSAGDFVRWCRQVIDLLDQIDKTADDPEIAGTAAKAVRAVRRGVVAVDAA
ncbi:RNA helicase [Nocardia asteroides NBRC 15531]|uniref:Probable helicase HelY n=1 Tax=Nocardia asteroides NBRC 15531 TaxID=1110697 RepID=U5E726_NOCAS|nr:RNA helicase [Nocardia asteroides]TLF67471.1 RNA helicase [Nocardia asteroides NBRC 15531]UGT51035.1 RNA helicase [Nocardia asteroides]SFN40883.1 ATP-dependent RNA helicase HelY [Nocardia asteroides]VEG36100.1 ski2-like helicase [Nocardia asteroides]GAD85737.1 putative helicase [Nocardia asteroides NBRC 15531]